MSALQKLEAMNDEEFRVFMEKLPKVTQMLVRSGLVDWREVLPVWYERIYD